MCLHANKRSTDEFKQKKTGKITVWKVYRKIGKKLYSTIYPTRSIKSGNIVSNINTTRFPLNNEFNSSFYFCIGKGIHVFLTREIARNYKNRNVLTRSFFRSKDYVVVKCLADMKDFVACNTNKSEAVFTKIHISPDEFERGLKNRN